MWEIKFHMRCIFLKVIEQRFVGTAQDIVDFMNLIDFVVTGEQRKQRDNFEQDAANTPEVHLVTVVAIG